MQTVVNGESHRFSPWNLVWGARLPTDQPAVIIPVEPVVFMWHVVEISGGDFDWTESLVGPPDRFGQAVGKLLLRLSAGQASIAAGGQLAVVLEPVGKAPMLGCRVLNRMRAARSRMQRMAKTDIFVHGIQKG